MNMETQTDQYEIDARVMQNDAAFYLVPLSEAGKEWLGFNDLLEPSGNSIFMPARAVFDTCDAMLEDGLEVAA